MASRGPSSERKSYTQGPVYLCDTCPTPSGWPLFFFRERRELLALPWLVCSILAGESGADWFLALSMAFSALLYPSSFSLLVVFSYLFPPPFPYISPVAAIPLFPADVAAWAAAVAPVGAAVAAHVADWAASATPPGTVLVAAAAAVLAGFFGDAGFLFGTSCWEEWLIPWFPFSQHLSIHQGHWEPLWVSPSSLLPYLLMVEAVALASFWDLKIIRCHMAPLDHQ